MPLPDILTKAPPVKLEDEGSSNDQKYLVTNI
jgi:hypothetical protein